MTDRRVSVSLSADISRFQRALATAAAEAGAFGRALDGVNSPLKKTENQSEKTGKEIDKLSGRLGLLADAALTLGPALIPLGAATIPVLTAALAGLGAAAGGIGVTVLAIQGLGDGLKALDAYQLKPTTANLEKLRVEMDKLGPSGAHFVHFIDDLEPQLHDLQDVARAGLFPGVEAGITDLLTRLPQVKRIVGELSLAMGDLASQAGEGLASDKFTGFFNYIESDARPTLEAFARSAGNVAEGVANLFVAFAPLNRDFTSGLEGATQAFARWSEGLDKNQSFQDFLAYIRESGPKAVEFLGSLVQALAGLTKAAAPMGQVVLPALTAVARVFATIANSPVGPALYTAAAAFVAFNRAASLTGKAVTGVSGTIKRLGTDVETTSGRLRLFGAQGGVVLAGAAAVGLLADNINRIDTANLDRSLTALTFGDVTGTIDKVVSSLEELTATRNKVDLGEIVTAGGLFGDSSLDKFADNVDQVDQKLAQLVETGQKAEAADLFQKITDLASAKGVDPSETAKRFDAYALALQNVASAAGAAGSSSDGLRSLLSGVRHEMDGATQSAQEFSDALAGLNGWLDKRQAIRDYRKSISDLGDALHNGFQPKDADTIDAVGRNIAQVANAIKDKGLRADFLQGARASLEELANKSGPRAKAEVEKLIGALDRYGLTHPKAKLDADDGPARHKLDGVNGMLHVLDRYLAKPSVDAETGGAVSAINQVTTMLRNLNGTTATTYVRTVRTDIPLPGAHAYGGLIRGPGGPRDDRIPALLSDREYVMRADAVSKYGVGMMDAINARRFAGGGSTGGAYHSMIHGDGGGPAVQVWTDGVYSVAKALKALKAELDAAKKSLEKERSTRDDLQSQFDSIKSTVGSAYSSRDPFAALQQTGSVWATGGGMGNPLAAFDTAVAGNTADTKAAETALAFAKSHGLDGPLYAALAASGNLPLLQAFANLSSAEIDQREQAFAAQSNAQSALGGMAANAEVGAQLADANKRLDRISREVQNLNRTVREADKNNQKAQDKNAKDVKDGVNGAASSGHRRRH